MNFETLLDALMREHDGQVVVLVSARADDLCHDRRPALVPACRPGPIDSPRRHRPVGRAWSHLGSRPQEYYDLLQGTQTSQKLFTGLLAFDQFTVFFRLFLTTFLILVTALTAISGIPDLRGRSRFLHAALWRHARHVADGQCQQPADPVPGRRDGQRSQLRDGGLPQGPSQEQRSVAQVRGLRGRGRGRHALRHQPDGRPVGNGQLHRDGCQPRPGGGRARG